MLGIVGAGDCTGRLLLQLKFYPNFKLCAIADTSPKKEKMTEEELKKHMVYPFNPDTTISVLEWIGLNIMHAVTHIGQALRLQSLYLRNRISENI